MATMCTSCPTTSTFPSVDAVHYVSEHASAHERGDGFAELGVRPNAPKHVRDRRHRRQAQLARLGYTNYNAYLRSPHWQATKARYRQSDLPQDCICGETEVQLHHMTYKRIGGENLTDLTPLCHRCHALIHVLEFRGEIGLNFEGFFDSGRAVEGRDMLRDLAEQQRREVEAARRERQAEVLSLSFATRLLRVREHARFRRHIDITSHTHVLKHMVRDGKSDQALTRKLRQIEEIVYGWDGWRDAA